jgi:hypothetical protein
MNCFLLSFPFIEDFLRIIIPHFSDWTRPESHRRAQCHPIEMLFGVEEEKILLTFASGKGARAEIFFVSALEKAQKSMASAN